MIDPTCYDRCIKSLIARGFYPIDSLSKKYATGFMMRGNPIIIDLHTEMAVLGVKYLSSDSILERSREIKFHPCCDSDPLSINALDPATEAIVAIAHSVIKEGTVTMEDLAKVHWALHSQPGLVERYIDEEKLQLASSVFADTAMNTMCDERAFKTLIRTQNGVLDDLARVLSSNSVNCAEIPVRLPAAVSLITLYDILRRRDEIAAYFHKPLLSLRFRRNAVRLGQKILLTKWAL